MFDVVLPEVDPHGHCGDTFRELAVLWGKRNLCRIVFKETSHVWFSKIGHVILYDRPRLDWFDYTTQFEGVLWGNTVPPGGIPWTFWGRRPTLMEKNFPKSKTFRDRSLTSFFAGKVENKVQETNRCQKNWGEHIELFKNQLYGDYAYTQEQYLQILKETRYGLCLPGFGPKCNREIELLCMGAVPILTPGVDTTYHDPLVENVHYIRVEEPEQIPEKLASVSESHWNFMSHSGRLWYTRNCSVEGSFQVTLEALYQNRLI